MKNTFTNLSVAPLIRTFNPIFLTGFSGSGKSSKGAFLAKKYQKNFIDLDNYIVEKNNKTISEIFENEGEQEFRKLEHNALKEISALKNSIVATGGGTPCFFDNMTLMNKSGVTIFLKTSVETLFKRLVSDKKSRPLLAGKSDDEILEYIKKELKMREKFYNMAQYAIFT